MRFVISEDIFQMFPEAIVGVAVAEGVNNRGESQEVMGLLNKEASEVRNELEIDTLAQNPLISNWRRTYKVLGVDKERASHEALTRRVLKGNSIRHINKLVDIYNYLSLKYETPFGGEDLDKIEGDIYLRQAGGAERFVQLGSTEATHPEKGEVVYMDSKEVICRRWNWRESENTELTDETVRAFLVAESLPPLTETTLRTALDECAALLAKFCQAKTKVAILSKNKTELSW